MGSPHQFGHHALLYAVQGGAKIADPGNGNTIPLQKSFGVCGLTLSSAGQTRLLPSATSSNVGVGTRIIVVADEITSSGTCTVEGILFSSEGQWAEYVCVQYNSARAWVATPAGQLTATAAEINRVADVSARIVNIATDMSITVALHEGKVLVMGGAGTSRTFSLPAATGSGAKFTFIVGAVNTSNYVIETFSPEEFRGNVFSNATGDTPDLTSVWPAGSAEVLTLNGTTTGGASIGDMIEVIDIASGVWHVIGFTTSSGAEATPFS